MLTCHLDCRFGSDEYAATMLELIERHPRAAAITGQPRLPSDRLAFAEKLNVVSNLMDVVPDETTAELEPVGFAEGRCDVFRVDALRSVGLYDTRLRTSGEDQVLAARLRAKGYSIYKAPRLEYRLSVSGEQDSVGKLVRHQHLFGRTTPYIVLGGPRELARARRAGGRRESHAPRAAAGHAARRRRGVDARSAVARARAGRRGLGRASGAGPRRQAGAASAPRPRGALLAG